MKNTPRIAAAVLTAAVGLAVAPVAAADPTPAPPTLVDCGPYGGVSKALEATADHVSPPLGTPSPLPPGLRADPPLRCQ